MINKNALDSLDSKDKFQIKVIDKESENIIFSHLLNKLECKIGEDINTLPSNTSLFKKFPYYIIYNKTNIWWLVDIYEMDNNDFKSQQEIWEYLINGGKVQSIKNYKIYFFQGGKLLNRGLSLGGSNNFCDSKEWRKYIKKEWYKNIPKQGILCWVFIEGNKLIRLIGNYEDAKYYSKSHPEVYWDNAIPLTEEEVREFIYKEK